MINWNCAYVGTSLFFRRDSLYSCISGELCRGRLVDILKSRQTDGKTEKLSHCIVCDTRSTPTIHFYFWHVSCFARAQSPALIGRVNAMKTPRSMLKQPKLTFLTSFKVDCLSLKRSRTVIVYVWDRPNFLNNITNAQTINYFNINSV